MRAFIQLVRFVQVGLAARTVQDWLWGGPPGRSNRPETWAGYLDTMQKRIDRLRALDRTNGSWPIEARKRLLQLAAVAVALTELIDAGGGRP